jgi:gas vesicle protein
MNSNNSGSSILTLVTGAAIGAALGVLFAPEGGEQTRKKLVKTAKRYAEPIVEKVKKGVEDVYDWTEEITPSMLKKEEKNDTGSFFLTALLAIPVGAALGILFAPAPGSETRQKIAGSVSGISGNIFRGEGEGVQGQKQTGKGKQHYAM